MVHVDCNLSSTGVYQLDVGRASNCFLLTEPITMLIDSGMPQHGARIAECLATVEVSLHDVRRLLLTHYDLDHIGSAQELRRVTGMDVHLHPSDVPYALGRRRPRPLARVLVAAVVRRRMRYGPPQPTLPLVDGELIGDVEVIHTPGHTPGHVCLLRDGVLFVGDAFITGDRFRESPAFLAHDRQASRASLQKLLDYDFHTAVSGHGPPTTDAKDKLAALVRKLGGKRSMISCGRQEPPGR